MQNQKPPSSVSGSASIQSLDSFKSEIRKMKQQFVKMTEEYTKNTKALKDLQVVLKAQMAPKLICPPPAPPVAPNKAIICMFCKEPGNHRTKSCPIWMKKGSTPEQRRAEFKKRNWCLLCFQTIYDNNLSQNFHEKCLKTGQKCVKCMSNYPNNPRRAAHHQIMCVDKKPVAKAVATVVTAPVVPVNTTSCIFCNLSHHLSINCTVFKSIAERIQVMRLKHMCLRCLESINNVNLIAHLHCPKPLVECEKCRKDFHNSMFCDGSGMVVPKPEALAVAPARPELERNRERVQVMPATPAVAPMLSAPQKLKQETTKLCVICNRSHNISINCNDVISIPTPMAPALQGLKREADRYCQFCLNFLHNTMDCPKYFNGISAPVRRSMIHQENRCVQCFQPNTDQLTRTHTRCPNRALLCKLCTGRSTDDGKHHPLLCEFNDFNVKKVKIEEN